MINRTESDHAPLQCVLALGYQLAPVQFVVGASGGEENSQLLRRIKWSTKQQPKVWRWISNLGKVDPLQLPEIWDDKMGSLARALAVLPKGNFYSVSSRHTALGHNGTIISSRRQLRAFARTVKRCPSPRGAVALKIKLQQHKRMVWDAKRGREEKDWVLLHKLSKERSVGPFWKLINSIIARPAVQRSNAVPARA